MARVKISISFDDSTEESGYEIALSTECVAVFNIGWLYADIMRLGMHRHQREMGGGWREFIHAFMWQFAGSVDPRNDSDIAVLRDDFAGILDRDRAIQIMHEVIEDMRKFDIDAFEGRSTITE